MLAAATAAGALAMMPVPRADTTTPTPVPLPFADRAAAAEQLALALHSRPAGEKAVVLAIPRGGVPIGRIVADRLGLPLDVVLARKLGAPFNPELAVGAVDETGWVHIAADAAMAGAGSDYLDDEVRRQQARLAERARRYRHGHPPRPLAGRTAIVVDDGLATGATMRAALHALRARGATYLVCAVPVAAVEALAAVRPLVDELVCLATPPDFAGVGQFYMDFGQVDDTEVQRCLQADMT